MELARVVEFLNEQMDPAEVLAIEVKQYVKGSLKTFVPRVIGQTAHAVGKMARSGGRETEWTIDEVLADIEQRFGEDYYSVAKKLIEWSNNNMTRITGGRGKFDGSLYPVYENDGIAYYPFILWAYGRIEMQFQFLKKEGPFVAIALREELLNMLNMIDGIDMPPDSIERRPAFNLSVIADDPNFNKFIEIIEWIKRKVNS